MDYLVFALISYLYGSIPFAHIAALFISKKDLRREGSRNVGVTNAFKTAGLLSGSLTVIGEISKALVPILLGKYLPEQPSPNTTSCVLLFSWFDVFHIS